jgi:hypothetical protein
MDPTSIGFDPKKAQAKPNNKEGASLLTVGSQELFVYDIDLNHDNRKEFVVIYIRGGSMNTSGILSVIPQPEQDKIVKTINYDIKTIINKNLWARSSKDMSRFHLFLARPFIVKRKNQYIMRFLDTKTTRKITEYLWKKRSFKRL